MESTQRYVLAHLCVYFKHKKILFGLFEAAKEFHRVMERAKETHLQRKYDEMRDEQPRWTSHRIGCVLEDKRRCPTAWDNETGPYVDPHMIHCGFIKVDGVWRDLQLYASGLKKFTRPKRVHGIRKLLRNATGLTPRLWQIYRSTTHEDAVLTSWTESWDRPFVEWEE